MTFGSSIRNLALSAGIGLLAAAIPYFDNVKPAGTLWVFLISTLIAYPALRNSVISRDFEERLKRIEKGIEDTSKVHTVLNELKKQIESNKKLLTQTRNLTATLSTTIQEELKNPQPLLIRRRQPAHRENNVNQNPRRSARLVSKSVRPN